MNKDQRINETLHYWRDLAISNPSLTFGTEKTSNQIYHNLLFKDVPEKERHIDVSIEESIAHPGYLVNIDRQSPYAYPGSTFNNWIQYYADSYKTDVFIQEKYSYFCQFVSKDRKAGNVEDHLKVYIPLDLEHLEDGAKLIFNYLEDNNIKHQSRIGKKIRFDDIVVKLTNPYDLEKLINFVSSNSYIQEGSLPANPFAFQHKGIALAIDGRLSYNETVCDMIDLYLKYKRQTNTLDKIDVNDFYSFLEKAYMDRFTKTSFLTPEAILLNEYFERKTIEKLTKKGKKQDIEEIKQLIENYRQVIQLIYKSHRSGFGLNDYLKHYSENLRGQGLSERMVLETNRLLIEALETMTIRFGAEEGFSNVYSFYQTGEATLITRKNNLRYRMIDNNFRTRLKRILDDKKMTFDDYAKMVLNQYHIDLVELERSYTP